MFGSLRQGDFGFVFARPETGKTTFLASEVTHMATQLGVDSGPVLWCNLEEGGNKVKLRLFQAALGMSVEEIMKDIPAAQTAYNELTKGKILLYDNATTDQRFIANLCDKYKPSLVVIDQLDKIYGFQNDREDLRLGQIYVWARELAKKYCPVIGVCQANADGEGRIFLSMAEIANSKTGKAAEADWILGIGCETKPGHEYIRGLSAIKNKLLGDGSSVEGERHARAEVLIKPGIQRYIDIG